jgi:hypothetical protein
VDPAADVVVLEAAATPLNKVRISGGGRCNLTHAVRDLAHLLSAYPRGGPGLRRLLARFGPRETVAWFEGHGVALKTEADGRMFPITDDSATVVECLLEEAKRLGVRIECRACVTGVFPGLRVETAAGARQADAVLLAPGGSRRSHPWLTRLGHTVVSPVPSLFTFHLEAPDLAALAGISVPAVEGRLQVGETAVEQAGDLLFTHWGLSGPIILRLSAWGARMLHDSAYRGRLELDLLPGTKTPALLSAFQQNRETTRRREVGADAPALPRRLWRVLVERAGIPLDRYWSGVSNQAMEALSAQVKRLTVEVVGKGEFKEEFVTAGGVPLDEVDIETMESRRTPGLYLAGEVLDVDGLTGGFNFQNAWSGGWVAGEAMGRRPSPP